MEKQFIMFHSTEEILEFVESMQKLEYDVDLRYGHLIVDAKSLLGALAIGVNQRLEVCRHTLEV